MGTQITTCLIIGGGVAGVSAASWLRSLRTPFMWVSRGGDIGGMLARVHNPITNALGGPFASGLELREILRAQVSRASFAPPTDATITSIERSGDGLLARTRRGESILASAVLLATGTRYRRLGVPGEEDLITDRVSHSASADGARFARQEVAVVGGGDAAFENALILADRHHCRVHLLTRSDVIRARQDFATRVRAHKNIVMHPAPSIVRAMTRTTSGVHLSMEAKGRFDALEVAAVFIRIGVEPVLPQLPDEVARDEEGFVVVDPRNKTTLDGLYAAGDITHHRLRAVACAAGHGATAAHSITGALGRFGSGEPLS